MRESFAQQARPGIGAMLGGEADGARRAGLAATQLQRYLTGPLSPARAGRRRLNG